MTNTVLFESVDAISAQLNASSARVFGVQRLRNRLRDELVADARERGTPPEPDDERLIKVIALSTWIAAQLEES